MAFRSAQSSSLPERRPLQSFSGSVVRHSRAVLLAAFAAGCSGNLDPASEMNPSGQEPETPGAGTNTSGMDGTPGAGSDGTDGTDPGKNPVTNPDGSDVDPATGGTNPAQPGTGPSDGTPPDGTSDGNPSATPGEPSVTAPVDCGSADVSASVLRRLSRIEYQFSLQELFQLAGRPAVVGVPEDSDFKGFRTLAALQNVTTEHLRAYQEEATILAEDLLADAARREAVVGCEVGAAGCLESFITDFGRLAYRRALSDDERAALLEVATQTGGTDEEQFTAVVAALLSSANFLFRVEVGDAAEGVTTIAGEELASRLSFTLIGRTPSRALLDKAAAGELDSDEGLASAAKELLADSRAQEFYDAFFQQWLGFETLRAPNDPSPAWNDALLLSMSEESTRVLDEYAWAEGQNFLDVLTANHTYVRADLADFYGLPAPAANGRVEFPADHHRAGSGLLTHAALISAKRDGDRIAHRGAWVQKTFLCRELEIPTALLDSLSDELDGLTYQQMLDRRNSDQACAGCHAQIDPIGVGFTRYDESGHYDETVDIAQFGITPALPGVENGGFSNLGELASLLRARPELAGCLTDRVFLYTDGREATGPDSCRIEHAAGQFTTDNNRFVSILEGLVLAPEFRLRRAPEVEAATP